MSNNEQIKEETTETTGTRDTRKNGKGGRRNKNGKGRGGRKDKFEAKDKVRMNDPIWYMSNEYVKDKMAEINWSNVSGLGLELSEAPSNTGRGYARLADAQSHACSSQFIQPSTAMLRFVPCIPTETGYGAINTEAQAIFTYVRKNNAAGTPYQSADLMLYLLALDSAYMFFAMVRRAFGLVSDYSMFNRYKPAFLVEALGFSHSEIIDNHDRYLTFINQMADKLNTLAVPKGVSLYARHAWMTSYVWSDEEALTASFYAYVPEGLYHYSHTASFTGGELEYKPWATKVGTSNTDGTIMVHTISELQDYWKANFEPLFHDQDVAIMSGDILRAYGADIMRLNATDTSYSIIPTYSQEVLDQICNSRFMGSPVNEYDIYSKTFNIKQNAGRILFDPFVYRHGTTSFENLKMFLNSSKDVPTSGDILVMTRNVAATDNALGVHLSTNTAAAGTGVTLYDTWSDLATAAVKDHVIEHIATCGSEIFTYLETRNAHWRYQTLNYNLDQPEITVYAGPDMYRQIEINADGPQNYQANTLGMYYRPRSMFVNKSTITSNTSGYGNFAWSGQMEVADLHRYTVIDFGTLLRMNDAIMYSMFDIAKY